MFLAGCKYDTSAIVVDSCGCRQGCGTLVCATTAAPVVTKITTNCGPCPSFDCFYQEGIICVYVLLTTLHGMILIEKYKEFYV